VAAEIVSAAEFFSWWEDEMEYPISHCFSFLRKEDLPPIFGAEVIYKTGHQDEDSFLLARIFNDATCERTEFPAGKMFSAIVRHEGVLWVIFRDDDRNEIGWDTWYVARPVTEEEKKAVVAQLDYLRERSNSLKPIFSEGG